MNLTVNGKALSIDKSINLKELLTVAKAEQPDYVTVELNGEFVDHSGFERRSSRTATKWNSSTSWEAVQDELFNERTD